MVNDSIKNTIYVMPSSKMSRDSELPNTDFKMIVKNKADGFFVSYCFCNPSTTCICGINWSISIRSVVKISFTNVVHLHVLSLRPQYRPTPRVRCAARYSLLRACFGPSALKARSFWMDYTNDVYSQSENWKLNWTDFSLILLDFITYVLGRGVTRCAVKGGQG